MTKKNTAATIDRARELIERVAGGIACDGDGDLAFIADELAKDGLLAPDLPPVIVDDFDERPHVIITGTHARDKARLRVDEHGVFHAINAWSDPTNPAEARERAYALLALANHVEGPGDQKAAPSPVPALPDGWRLADHHDYGRVIVTTENPDDDGFLAFVHRADDRHRQHAHGWCKPDALTYIDSHTTQEDDQ